MSLKPIIICVKYDHSKDSGQKQVYGLTLTDIDINCPFL